MLSIRILIVITISNWANCVPVTSQNDDKLINLNKRKLTTDLTTEKIKNNVITTIDQVQEILERDPNLPRLTKGEIEDLFEEVTKEEYEKSLREGNINRANHMRALMLVLPYNTNGNSDQNLQELYNRPPVTKVIPSESKRDRPLREIIQQPSGKVQILSIGDPKIPIDPTTYKPPPMFRKKIVTSPPALITTYHPGQNFRKPLLTNQINLKSSQRDDAEIDDYVTTIDIPGPVKLNRVGSETEMLSKRFSSHYNAKQTNFHNKDIYYNKNVPTMPAENPKSNFNGMTNTELENILNNLGIAENSKISNHKVFANSYPKKQQISSTIKQDRISIEEDTVDIEDFTKPLVPQIKSNDYVAFKPISFQSNAHIEPELEDYLVRFGLVKVDNSRSNRRQKALNAPPIIEKTTGALEIETTKEKLHLNSNDKKIVKRIDTNIDDLAGNTNKNDPTETDNNDYRELERFLKNIRELQELRVNLTEDHLNKLQLSNYNLSDSLLVQGPNPLHVPEFSTLQKNEIKRQENSSGIIEPTRFNLDLPTDVKSSTDLNIETTTETNLFNLKDDIDTTTGLSATTTTTEISFTTTSATEESANGSLSDLEDSFGKLDPATEEPLPPPRKNGFYFLADINHFLEVGDGDEKVVVRFNPKIGDPSRFIPVKVP